MDMSKFESLPKRFAEAGLVLKLLNEPFNLGASGIVQMDIRREVKKGSSFRGEHFVIYPGAPENTVQVRAVDRKLGQVVLLVKEQAQILNATIDRAEGAERRLAEMTHDLQDNLTSNTNIT